MIGQHGCEIEEAEVRVLEAFSRVFRVRGGPTWNSSFTMQGASHPRGSRATECNGIEIFFGAGELLS